MKQLQNFEEASRYLNRYYRNARTEYKLDNMWQLMEWLGSPQEKFRTVHVAGTSGKTSTAYYMSALLAASGKKTGLTVSPHVDQINERLQINTQPVEEALFCSALTEFLHIVEGSPIKPSWFEVMVAFAYWYFAREEVEYVVVEVGLGGLKDGTNVINRPDKVCIITDIGYDHIGVLGSSLPEIAAQKIGIVRRGNTVFTYSQTPEVLAVFDQAATNAHATMHVIAEETQPVDERLPAYQYRNWCLAYETYSYLSNRDKLTHLTRQVLTQTQQIHIPGRMDTITKAGKTIIMDGAHNAQKMTAFVQSFQKLYPSEKPAVLLSLKEGKEHETVIPILAAITDHIIVTTFDVHQDLPLHSMDPATLAQAARDAGVAKVEIIPNQNEALAALLDTPETAVVITGSFYMLNQIRNNERLIR